MPVDPASKPRETSKSMTHVARLETETSAFADDLDYVVQLSTNRDEGPEASDEAAMQIIEMQNRDSESGDVQKAA